MLPDEAVSAIREQGYAVLRQVIDARHVQVLRERMWADLDEILADPQRLATQFTTGNIQQDPPPFPPYLFADVLSNDAVVAVSQGVLGSGLRNVFYSGNTNLPGSRRQPVHFDTASIWPGERHPAHELAINVPLVDFTVANGATEIWPGTHLALEPGVDGSLRLASEALAAWRPRSEPFQVEMSVGDVLIRDLRLWHAGMPNTTTRARTMIAMVHVARWWNSDAGWPGRPMVFARGSESALQHPVLTHHACFEPLPIDYLFRHGSHDLQG